MQRELKRVLSLAAVVAFALTAFGTVRADGWGNIKGQVVWGEKEIPKRAELQVDKDRKDCEKQGKLLDDKLIINPKNKGVRWCVVYLTDVSGFDKNIPIHPKLKEIQQKTVEIDQPCCQFEPHMLAMREGQTLIVKNSAAIAHNVNFQGGTKGPNINQITPPGGSLKLEDIAARYIPIQVACNIHPWMSSRVAVLKNPYFAVTDADGNFEIKDAPAGNFRVVIWHEASGWVIGDKQPDKKGKKIVIENEKTTDLGQIPLKPTKE